MFSYAFEIPVKNTLTLVNCDILRLFKCGRLYQVILDLVSYKELTIRRLVDDNFNQPGVGVVSRVNDSAQLKPLFV